MNGAHLHLVLTHLPVVGVLVALGVLAFGLLRRQDVLQRAGFVLLVLTGLTAGLAYLTGEGAEEKIEDTAGVSESVIERHESAAQIAAIGAGIIGVLGVAALAVSWRAPVRRGVATLVLLGAMAEAGALAWTANRGGQIRHPEIGSAVAAGQGEGETENAVARDADDDD
jgi:uncharacterized membrane protein